MPFRAPLRASKAPVAAKPPGRVAVRHEDEGADGAHGEDGGQDLRRRSRHLAASFPFSVQESSERSLREQAELGRLLAAAAGYLVLASDGRQAGQVDHIRYERHSDHPDKIIIRRGRMLWKRRRALPFDAVQAVNPTDGTVVLRIDSNSVDRCPSA